MTLEWLPPLRASLETFCLHYEVPLGLMVGWIECESGGRIGETTVYGEVGYAQLMPDEYEMLRLDPLKLSSDSDYSLDAGCILADHYRQIVDGWAVSALEPGTATYWLLVKMAHSYGAGGARVIVKDAAGAGALGSWTDFLAFCTAHDADYQFRFRHSSLKWAKFVDRVRVIGEPFGLTMQSCPAPPAA